MRAHHLGRWEILAVVVCTLGCTSAPTTDDFRQNAPQPAPTVVAGQGAIDAGSDVLAPVPGSPFNAVTFEKVVQPILDNAEGKGCSASACHGAAAGLGGFKLSARPAAGSIELADNFKSVTALCDLKAPESSTLLARAA